MQYPTLKEERRLWKQGYKFVACIDEVGRGPLAGPVVACATTVQQFQISNFKFLKLKDSKKLTPKQREEFYKTLVNHPAIEWGIGSVSPQVIDRINIYQATKLAMKRAVIHLMRKADFLTLNHVGFRAMHPTWCMVVDGNMELDILTLQGRIPCQAIVKGDEKVFSCAIASIIAKVKRDRFMVRYHKKYPHYGFDKHKGYGTPHHMAMLKKYGPCPIHRRSFSPVSVLKSEIRISKFETNPKFKSSKF